MKEEITDLIADKAYEDSNFKKGLVLRFAQATIKVTKVDRKNKRCWGQHITLFDVDTAMTHYGHNVDITGDTQYCTDCEVPLSEPATEEGNVKYELRRREDDREKRETTGPEEEATEPES